MVFVTVDRSAVFRFLIFVYQRAAGYCIDFPPVTQHSAAVTVSEDGTTTQATNDATDLICGGSNQNRDVAIPLWPFHADDLRSLSGNVSQYCIVAADTHLSFCPLAHNLALLGRQLTAQWIGDTRLLGWKVEELLSLRNGTKSFPLLLEVKLACHHRDSGKHCKGVIECSGSVLFPAHWKQNYQHSKSFHLGQLPPESRAWNKEHSVEFEESVRAETCGIYMAQSGLKDAGFGLYTSFIPKEGTVVSDHNVARWVSWSWHVTLTNASCVDVGFSINFYPL